MRLRRHIWRGLACCAAALILVDQAAEAQLAPEAGPGLSTGLATAAAPVLPTESSFALSQMRYPRVREARIATRFNIKRLYDEKGIRYPAAEMFIRIFKRERTLEVWVRPGDDAGFRLLKSYDICALAGELGPKRRQGDNQVPEGFYAIDFFNPQSEYHLSLHVDYPNVRDRAATPNGTNPGGDIYIHGGCSSAGCLAITDNGIMELYWMAVEARAAGQQRIPVHIFPARLETTELANLQRVFAAQPRLSAFWGSLKSGYDFFEQTRRIPAVMVDSRGDYVVVGEAANASVMVGTLPAPAAPARPAARAAATQPTPARQQVTTRPPPLGTKVGGTD